MVIKNKRVVCLLWVLLLSAAVVFVFIQDDFTESAGAFTKGIERMVNSIKPSGGITEISEIPVIKWDVTVEMLLGYVDLQPILFATEKNTRRTYTPVSDAYARERYFSNKYYKHTFTLQLPSGDYTIKAATGQFHKLFTETIDVSVSQEGVKIIIIYEEPVLNGFSIGTETKTQEVLLKDRKIIINSDKDYDGLLDSYEDYVIALYSPYYKFHSGEAALPVDWQWFLERSALLYSTSGYGDSNPRIVANYGTVNLNNLLNFSYEGRSSNLWNSQCVTPFYLDIQDTYQDGHEGGWDGEVQRNIQWAFIQLRKNVGTYAHVVYFPDDIFENGRRGKEVIKIEYWQFYAYSNVHHTEIGDHEGDTERIIVFIDPQNRNVEKALHRVLYSRHNTYKIKLRADLNFEQGTHPVVYIQDETHGSLWSPGEYFWEGNADGKGTNYLTQNIPNLGEYAYPLNENDAFIQFSGRWGWDHGDETNTPESISLKHATYINGSNGNGWTPPITHLEPPALPQGD